MTAEIATQGGTPRIHRFGIPRPRTALIALALVLSTLAWGRGTIAKAEDTGLTGPGVYAMTNAIAGNQVVVYSRGADGTLTPAGTFPTGGTGSGKFEGSQNSLILDQNKPLLFAVNPGSGDISALAIRPDGLTLVSKVSSGGMDPTSLTIHANLLYVLNTGASPNITGFNVRGDGELTPLAGSTRSLSGGSASVAAQVGFSPNGKVLVVSERGTNIIDTYTVGADGLATGSMANKNAGDEPFGFAFTTHGQAGHLITTEAHRGAPGQGAASSYAVSDDGSLQVISDNVQNTQTDTCWIVITSNQRYAYVAHLMSNTVSSYRIGTDGSLSLLNPVAGTAGPSGSVTIDEALSNNSHFLYVRNNTNGTTAAFAVHPDGSLTAIQTIGGLPPGAIGIAAR